MRAREFLAEIDSHPVVGKLVDATSNVCVLSILTPIVLY